MTYAISLIFVIITLMNNATAGLILVVSLLSIKYLYDEIDKADSKIKEYEKEEQDIRLLEVDRDFILGTRLVNKVSDELDERQLAGENIDLRAINEVIIDFVRECINSRLTSNYDKELVERVFDFDAKRRFYTMLASIYMGYLGVRKHSCCRLDISTKAQFMLDADIFEEYKQSLVKKV